MVFTVMYDKSSEQSSQSAKDVLEDIKKVVYNKGSGNKSFTTDQKLDNEEDISYLQEEDDDESDDFLSFDNKKGIFENMEKPSSADNVFNHPPKLFTDTLKAKTDNNKQNLSKTSIVNSTQRQKDDESDNDFNDSLISKENIDASSAEIQHLVEEVYKSHRSSNGYNLTIEELAINLLKPELSKWLNNHLHNLVKEIVEKEIKHITSNS